MRKFYLLSLVTIVLLSCKEETQPTLFPGTYRVVMDVGDNQELPFIMEVESRDHLKIFNGEEIIKVDEVEYKNDSVYIKMPVFESILAARINQDSTLNGFYVKPNLNRTVSFSAKLGSERFITKEMASYDLTGHWETVFSPNSEEDKSEALGIFEQKGHKVLGTFRTTTGDYRFLEGVLDGNQLKLSTFDGSHAYLFQATVSDSTMEGMYYSGNHWKEPFIAKRNDSYELADGDSLTFLKEGYDKLEFSFPDSSGNMMSLEDERFKNKVVVVQLMGSWCPNCLDESRFLSEYYKTHQDQPLEMVALAFEYAKTEELAFKSINRLKEGVGINYPVLLAQYGSSSKGKAQEKLPMLNHVWSYPTSIFIDKKGQVRKIHTGFNGPATGKKYEEFKLEFETFVNELLSE